VRKQLTDAHYGLGWPIYNVDEIEIIYHCAWVQGYRAVSAFSKKKKKKTPQLGVGYAVINECRINSTISLTQHFGSKTK